MLIRRKRVRKSSWGKVLASFALAMLVACGDDGSSGDEPDVLPSRGTSVSGFVQKGPFTKGAHIALQELDSRALIPIGDEFEGEIENDRGEYSIEFGELGSPYVRLRAKGIYRNEVTGEKTELPFDLLALTDITDRETANVNLLTHLEYMRAGYLVRNEGLSFKQAKQRAEREVLASFAITGDYDLAEDLDIFKPGEGNAVLLAVSLLMQMNLGADEFADRVSKYVDDIEKDGVWDDSKTAVKIADWAAERSLSGNFSTIRNLVASWGYSEELPYFEKYVDNFWWKIYGLGECNLNRENEVVQNKNASSAKYEKYFMCNGSAWHIAEETDNDGGDDEGDGDTTETDDSMFGEECTEFGQVVGGSSIKDRAYFCYGNKWKKFYGTGDKTYGKLEDERDGQIYRTIQIGKRVWMAENLNYNVGYNFVPGDLDDTFGGYYRWEDIGNACPAGWYVPSKEEWESLYATVSKNPLSLQSSRFPQWNFSFDMYGFSVVPAGILFDNADEDEEYRYAAFWTSSYKEEDSKKQAYAFILKELTAQFEIGLNGFVRMSVRCIEDTNKVAVDTLETPVDTGRVEKDSVVIDWTIRDECTESRRGWTIHVIKGDSSRYFICKENGWLVLTVEEYDEYRWTVGTEGQCQRKADTQDCYVYEDGSWQLRDSSNCSVGLRGCTAARQGEVGRSSNDGWWYLCDNYAWEKILSTTADTLLLGHDHEEGAVASGPASKTTYVYQDGKWRQGTKMDSIMVSLGETACLVAGDTSKVKYEGQYYVCTYMSWSSVPLQWEVAPLIYNDTYDDRPECSATGLYGDGRFHDKYNDPARIYVCDNGDFRMQYMREYELDAGCTSYILGKKMELNNSHFVCTEDGWHIDSTALEQGTFVDERDGREYKTIGIWTQVWMAENLDYRDSIEMPELEGNRWCYGDDVEKCNTYGSIYTCEMAKQVCPDGWHLPTKDEWYDMLNFVTSMGGITQTALRSTSGWIRNLNGTDAIGFNVLPGGFRFEDGFYSDETETAWFWYDGDCGKTYNDGIEVEIDYRVVASYMFDEKTQYYIRCVKDEE